MLLGSPPDMVHGFLSHRTHMPHDKAHIRAVILQITKESGFRKLFFGDFLNGFFVAITFLFREFVEKIIIAAAITAAIAAAFFLVKEINCSSADYSTEERVEANKAMTAVVLENSDEWDEETVICIVDSAYRPLFGKETDYTVSVYILDQEAFAAGQADSEKYTLETLWAYSKSGPKKDKFQSLIKVAEASIQKNEDTGEILSCTVEPLVLQ